jgi:hypothetical protein
VRKRHTHKGYVFLFFKARDQTEELHNLKENVIASKVVTQEAQAPKNKKQMTVKDDNSSNLNDGQVVEVTSSTNVANFQGKHSIQCNFHHQEC